MDFLQDRRRRLRRDLRALITLIAFLDIELRVPLVDDGDDDAEPIPESQLIFKRFLVITPGLDGGDVLCLLTGVLAGDFCKSANIFIISSVAELLRGLLTGDFLVASTLGSILRVTMLYFLSRLPRLRITSSSRLEDGLAEV